MKLNLDPCCHFPYEMGGVRPSIKKYFVGLPEQFCRAHFVAKACFWNLGTHFVAKKAWTVMERGVKSGHFWWCNVQPGN